MSSVINQRKKFAEMEIQLKYSSFPPSKFEEKYLIEV